MKKIKFSMLIVLPACVLLVLSACGYHLEGGGYIDNTIRRIAVKVFDNKSSETGAGLTFTNELVQEIYLKTDTKVVDAAVAEYIIEGQVESITFSELSRSTTESVLERKVTAIVDLKIKDKAGDVVWSVNNFSSNEDYTVSSDTIEDETNRRVIVEKIALRTAERLVSKMLNNF